ncbi:MAG: hypothetical protein Q4B91_07510 [Atopobiaceae bacterium]|nr:hypothetical protein [Atopobiaceae bacterium]
MACFLVPVADAVVTTAATRALAARERAVVEVEAAGGSFSAGPGEGGGWRVWAALPRMAREGNA